MRITAIENGEVFPDVLFGKNNIDLISNISDQLASAHSHENQSRGTENPHEDISTWSFIDEAPLNQARFYAWLKMLYSLHASKILRLKGLVRLESNGCPLLIQGVGPILNTPHFLSTWPEGVEKTRLVFIFRGISTQALEESFMRHIMS